MLLTYPLVAWFYIRALLVPWGMSLLPRLSAGAGHAGGSGQGRPRACGAGGPGSSGRARRLPYRLRFAVLWSVLTIALPLFAAGTLQVHDRYLYLPSIGLAMVLGTAVTHMPGLWAVSQRAAQLAAVSALVLALGGMSFLQIRTWEDDLTVFTNAYRRAPGNVRAQQLLAQVYLARGENDAGLRLLTGALARHPQAYQVHLDLGFYYYRQGEPGAAKQYFGRVAGDGKAPRKTRAAGYYYLALMHRDQGLLSEAERQLEEAVRLDPQATQYRRAAREILERRRALERR